MSDDHDPYWPHATRSLTTSKTGDKSPRNTTEWSQHESPKMTRHEHSLWLASRARAVFAAYRSADFADPENYLLQLASVLERYPIEVVKKATDAAGDGIQRQCKFPPSIAEMVEWCDIIVSKQDRQSSWDERSRKQLAERAAHEAEQKNEDLEHRKKVAERIRSELRAKGFAI